MEITILFANTAQVLNSIKSTYRPDMLPSPAMDPRSCEQIDPNAICRPHARPSYASWRHAVRQHEGLFPLALSALG